MKRKIIYLLVIFFSAGLLSSGMQTITGYYSDPSGYGFHNLQAGYFFVSAAVIALGALMMLFIARRVEKFFW